MSLVSWAYELAVDKLALSLPRRWRHVQGVTRQARRLGGLNRADFETFEAAALLHDIGYAPDLVDTGFHPIDGALYLKSIDAPRRIVDLVAPDELALITELHKHGLKPAHLAADVIGKPLIEHLRRGSSVKWCVLAAGWKERKNQSVADKEVG